MINKLGDKGSPCFTALVDLKKPCDCQLSKTEYQLLEIIPKIRPMNLSSNPIFLNTLVKKSQDSLSYAFVMSNLIATFGPAFVLNLISVIISCVNKKFSTMFLPFTNPACSFDIRFGSSPTSLSWTTLEKILLTKLLRQLVANLKMRSLLSSWVTKSNLCELWTWVVHVHWTTLLPFPKCHFLLYPSTPERNNQ